VTNSKTARNSKISPARLLAFEILRSVEEDGAYASVLLAQEREGLSARDRNLTHELTLGVLRWQLQLDQYITHFADRDSARLDLPVLIALRLAFYQLIFLSRIPPSAAVNEAVELVRFARFSSADKFVNAVLRRALREPNYNPLALIEDPLESLAIETSHPRWLLEKWSEAFGREEARAIAQANNEPAPVSFRLTGQDVNEEQILSQLRAAGNELIPSKIVSHAWRISGSMVQLQELMRSGQVYLQDEASQLVAHAVTPQSAQYILDLCAAPGSKSTHLARLTNGSAAVIAADLYEHRLREVTRAARTQQHQRLYCVGLDARQPLPFAEPVFDRVLVDAPCSGTGTLRRNPEIRWRIRPEDIAQLSRRQKLLLSNAAKVLKPGGRLVYSTCSLEPEENEEVVQAFLERHRSFVTVDSGSEVGLSSAGGSVRTWPNRQGTDGFFITIFESKRVE
jgi:16S rRNA (cytosine967-C5)-methyltransferase